MVKFSLYDFFGLLLSAVIFLYFGNAIITFYGVSPLQFHTDDWKINVGISLCFALIASALPYASSFYLINNTSWYNRLFVMNKHVADFDRMYYELEYHDKNEQPQTLLWFYFFFRQTALAGLILLLSHMVLLALTFIPCSCFKSPFISRVLCFAAILFAILFISLRLARWYRRFMTGKMYWAYFTHLNQNQDNGNN